MADDIEIKITSLTGNNGLRDMTKDKIVSAFEKEKFKRHKLRVVIVL